MAIKFPDKIEHNNPNLKVVDVEQVDGALGLLDANYTYTVNNDYSLNQALADAARYKPNEGFFIQILIDSEYTITEPVVINGGDYSHVIITTFNEVRSVSLSNNQNLFNLSNCIPFRLTNVRFEIISNSEFNSFIVAQNCNQILWQGVTCVNFHFRPVQLRTCQGRISNLIIDGANQTFGIAALWVYDNSLISFSNIQINNYDRAITIDSNTKVFIFQLQFTNGLSTPIGISVQNSELILRSANFRTIANEDSVNDLVLTGEARVFISVNSQGGVYSNPNTIANSSIIVDARKNYPFTFDNDIVTTRPQVVKHTSDLTGNIQEWRNLSDDLVAYLTALGKLTLSRIGLTDANDNEESVYIEAVQGNPNMLFLTSRTDPQQGLFIDTLNAVIQDQTISSKGDVLWTIDLRNFFAEITDDTTLADNADSQQYRFTGVAGKTFTVVSTSGLVGGEYKVFNESAHMLKIDGCVSALGDTDDVYIPTKGTAIIRKITSTLFAIQGDIGISAYLKYAYDDYLIRSAAQGATSVSQFCIRNSFINLDNITII